jgi:hypothetical protein
LGEKLDST